MSIFFSCRTGRARQKIYKIGSVIGNSGMSEEKARSARPDGRTSRTGRRMSKKKREGIVKSLAQSQAALILGTITGK